MTNRFAIIEQRSDPDNWHYLLSKLNPANLPNRGVSASSTEQLNAWLRGHRTSRRPVEEGFS